jgi:hypothetical protein
MKRVISDLMPNARTKGQLKGDDPCRP